MRIAVVSAHYPPNFVSGGTLVPQRLAQGLAGRGHEVGVFAGWLDLDGSHPERAALDAFDETGDDGVAVRWVVTTPYIGWADRANYDNPPVVERFAAWLAGFRPDVVHLHSLQSLGAGLVPAARQAGAKVVVTMHDFWWCCARQFLVDQTGEPCCLVVEAGVCPCEAGRDWLADRNRALRRDLAAADVVLAPSRSAAAVLAANGLAGDRLRVDENGLPEADLVAAPTVARAETPAGDGPDSVVRFTYAGGHNLMKGAGVITDAARLLARRRPVGWELTAYGLGPHLTDSGTNLGRAPVTVADPYAPSDLDKVLAATDVLVLPSVMRESHSILTREALTRGVPVITTDSLGPEEVIEAGVNGLVVPSADPEALAAAMARLVDDHEFLGRLTGGAAGHPVALRALSDQISGLEAMFTDLLAASPPEPAPTPRPVSKVVFLVGIEGAPLRYRARLPAEALALAGVTSEVFHYRDSRAAAAIAGADALVVYRVPATVQVRRLLDRAHRQGIPVVFDVDDLIFDPDLAEEIPALRILAPAESELWLQGVRRYRTTMEQADGFVGSTQALVDHAEAVTGLPTARFDNGVGLLLGRCADAALRRPRTPGPVRVGYFSGTITHDEDWFFVEPAVLAVLDAHPDVELWLGGHLPPSEALEPYGERVKRIPFTPWTDLSAVLRDLDVNLAPLTPGRFNEAKSAIKWLEAALTATPTVASPAGPFAEAIEHGVNGFLADDRDGWLTAIDALVSDDVLRRQLGARARRDALVRWSPHQQGRRYLAVLERARSWVGQPRPGDSERPAWQPVELDEPEVEGHPLEAYTLGDQPAAPVPAPPAPTAAAKARHLAGRVRRSVLDDGLAATARRARPFLVVRLRRGSALVDRASARLRGRRGA